MHRKYIFTNDAVLMTVRFFFYSLLFQKISSFLRLRFLLAFIITLIYNYNLVIRNQQMFALLQ